MATFADSSQKAYGQISVALDDQPFSRTVHIHAIESPIKAIVVNSNRKARKWVALEKNPKVAGCFWKPEVQTQFCFEGEAQLVTTGNRDLADLKQSMWLSMRPDVRRAYLLDENQLPMDDHQTMFDITSASKNHGLILIFPKVWDIFRNNSENYCLGRRTIYSENRGIWEQRHPSSLHSYPSDRSPE